MISILFAILAVTPQEAAPPKPQVTTPIPTQAVPATAATTNSEIRSSLMIDPKSRAHDYTQAFELLRREKPTLKINIKTASGLLANVSELLAAENGTLLLVKVPFTQGTKFLIVPIEDVQEIAYSP